MENLVWGIITFVLVSAGYIIAIRQFNKNHVTRALLLIMICGLLLRIFAAGDLYIHEWDERYHAVVAKNLIDHPLHPTLYDHPVLPYDFKNWTYNHTWVHKQPLPLWTMALSMWAFGVNEAGLRLPSVLLTTLGIWITFFIARYLSGRKVAFIAAILYSIHGLIIELAAGRTATDHIDVFFLFFIQLSVFFAIRFFQTGKAAFNLLCGVSIGLAILSKWLPALIVLPIWLLLALDTRRFSPGKVLFHFFILCVSLVAVALPWQLYIFSRFPAEARWESTYNVKHILEGLDGHSRPFYYHFEKLRILYGEMIYPALLWFFYKSFRKPRDYKRMILTIWILVPLIFFSFAHTKMRAYTIFSAPAIFIITALFWKYLMYYRNRFRYKWLIVAILILLIGLPVRYSIERTKLFAVMDRNPQWAKELRTLNRQTKAMDSVVVFNAERPIETMFYSNCTAYFDIPDASKLQQLNHEGYTILIRENSSQADSTAKLNSDEILLSGRDFVYNRYSPGTD